MEYLTVIYLKIFSTTSELLTNSQKREDCNVWYIAVKFIFRFEVDRSLLYTFIFIF